MGLEEKLYAWGRVVFVNMPQLVSVVPLVGYHALRLDRYFPASQAHALWALLDVTIVAHRATEYLQCGKEVEQRRWFPHIFRVYDHEIIKICAQEHDQLRQYEATKREYDLELRENRFA